MSKRRGAKSKPVSTAGKVKDSTQFLEALKLYESKSYKKSLKILETILKKDNSNADALALKGLDLLSTGERVEAESYVNNALSKIKGTAASAICCHVLGIYMRSTKNYSDSIKWFQASLDNGSNNLQIYRDLATLQSQVGDFKSVLASRKKYWESFMGYRANWTSLAVAQDINGEYQQAINTLSQFEKLGQGKLGEAEMYENNECLIYKNDIMYKAADSSKDKLEKVLKNLNDIEPNVFDKYAVLERKASIYMKMGDFKEASKVYRTLIKRNPDNFSYYKLLEVSLGITNNNFLRKALYEKMLAFYPRCEPPKYIPLTFIKDEQELMKKVKEYIIPQLSRGVPATFSNVKPLYWKRRSIIPDICERIVLEYLASLDPSSDQNAYIWTCYFLSQHYLNLKNYPKAQDFITKAIEHTPTTVEFYILKGRIMKHSGLLSDAADILEEGRKLDLQDRFINCKTAKYFLRANNISKAVEIVSLFTKNDDAVNGVKDLHLVEASWFILEQAEAYNRLYLESKKKLSELKKSLESVSVTEGTEGPTNVENQENSAQETSLRELEWETLKYKGLSLKRFTAISKFYNQFEDDQLDFHSYCMRKGTPRAYIEMLAWGRAIYTKPSYLRAMRGASKIYFEIYDTANAIEAKSKESAIPIKKSNKKLKKEAAALNKRKEEERKTIAAYPTDQDNDDFGDKMASTKKPIEDFLNVFYTKYNNQINDDAKDFILEFDTHYRTGKLALCLAALTKYAKYHNEKSGVVGAMSIILALSSREGSSFEEIPKKVAIKGLETEFSILPISEITNTEFNWLRFFEENYNTDDMNALLLLNRYNIGTDSEPAIKELILQKLTTCEPCFQNDILEYEL